MDELHAFFDRDVFVKLGVCDLWRESLAALKITHPYRLAAASPTGCRQVLKRKDMPEDLKALSLQRLEGMSQTTPTVPEEWARNAQTIDFFNQLNEVTDPGEALLAAVIVVCPKANCLVSGDKRFFRSLREELPQRFKELRPRLITFEECLLACIKMFGFQHVIDKVHPAVGCDHSLRLAIGSGEVITEESFIAALKSFGDVEN